MSLTLTTASSGLREALKTASRGLVEREALVDLIALGAVAGEHILVIGPPGTAKSEAVRRVARAIGGRYFEYLLGRFTEPSEIFGPIDLRALREGLVQTETAGMLPEAEIAFLDEVFLGSTAILNTLLGILNDRHFHRGHTRLVVPLRVCVGASNHVPEDLSLAAFADRFLVRLFVEPIPGPRLEELLESGWSLASQSPGPMTASVEHLDFLALVARAMDLSAVRPELAHAVRLLRGAGIELSDRRIVKLQRLIAAAAALAGRRTATRADLWPMVFAVPTAEQQQRARDVLREVLEASESPTLPAAAEEASLGPLARAARIVNAGNEILGARPDGQDPKALELWRLKIESLGREIDAGFAPERAPADLQTLRRRIVEELGAVQ